MYLTSVVFFFLDERSKLAQLGEETKDLDPEALGLLLAGGVAREVLRE